MSRTVAGTLSRRCGLICTRSRSSAGLSVIFPRVEALRTHHIDGRGHFGELGASSKTDTRWSFLSRLHGMGREAAERWLQAHRSDLGRHSTVDLDREFLE